MYLDKPILVKEKEIVSGHIVLKQNQHDNRLLVIELSFKVEDGKVMKKIFSLQ
jgi:hypothetical protein